MSENTNNEAKNLSNDEKEVTTMKENKAANWVKENGEVLAFFGMVAAIFGVCTVAAVADSKQQSKKYADRVRLEEKWMDTQLKIAEIQSDAEVRRKTATTSDIKDIVTTLAKDKS